MKIVTTKTRRQLDAAHDYSTDTFYQVAFLRDTENPVWELEDKQWQSRAAAQSEAEKCAVYYIKSVVVRFDSDVVACVTEDEKA